MVPSSQWKSTLVKFDLKVYFSEFGRDIYFLNVEGYNSLPPYFNTIESKMFSSKFRINISLSDLTSTTFFCFTFVGLGLLRTDDFFLTLFGIYSFFSGFFYYTKDPRVKSALLKTFFLDWIPLHNTIHFSATFLKIYDLTII